jgi:hypothetical protein
VSPCLRSHAHHRLHIFSIYIGQLVGFEDNKDLWPRTLECLRFPFVAGLLAGMPRSLDDAAKEMLIGVYDDLVLPGS